MATDYTDLETLAPETRGFIIGRLAECFEMRKAVDAANAQLEAAKAELEVALTVAGLTAVKHPAFGTGKCEERDTGSKTAHAKVYGALVGRGLMDASELADIQGEFTSPPNVQFVVRYERPGANSAQ